ncbi:MAG TPA: Spy/CpxP family protein refolding chaperone [Bryobacteraceae bacterium]|nr:Spy/CpxP family protein refolding chaperone [Bryobacteraceae bacterium]HOQ45553.1 Spy/CpxP family protein refolding chaperone [Bryobacteraceae bacterium]HPU73409.1 Spy/CpxP family protein refolding chaperone [Bryobacteraceae bacterium]
MRRVFKLAAVAAISSALAIAQGQGRQLGAAKGKGFGGFGGFGLGAPQLERLAEFLNLTDQQLEQARAIWETARAEEDQLETEAGKIRQQIQELIKAPTAEFDSQIQALLTAYAEAEAQELAIKARAMNRFWNLLTPEQQQKASELEKLLKPPAGNSGKQKENKEKENKGKGPRKD